LALAARPVLVSVLPICCSDETSVLGEEQRYRGRRRASGGAGTVVTAEEGVAVAERLRRWRWRGAAPEWPVL
jgi:hypothetical protein